MGKKHKCIDCVNHIYFAFPQSVGEKNYEYAKDVIRINSNSLFCLETYKTKSLNHEQQCKYFAENDEFFSGKDREKSRLNQLECLSRAIAEYEISVYEKKLDRLTAECFLVNQGTSEYCIDDNGNPACKNYHLCKEVESIG